MSEKEPHFLPSPLLVSAFRRYRSLVRSERLGSLLLNLLISSVLVFSALGLLNRFVALNWSANLAILLVVDSMFVVWCYKRSLRAKSFSEIQKALEIRNSESLHPLWGYREDLKEEFDADWSPRVDLFLAELKSTISSRVKNLLGRFVAAVLVLGFCWVPVEELGLRLFDSLRVAVQPGIETASLTIVKGHAEVESASLSRFNLSASKPAKFDLLDDNLVTIELKMRPSAATPLLELYRMIPGPDGEKTLDQKVYQSFRMLKAKGDTEARGSNQVIESYYLKVSINQSVGVKIPSWGGEEVLARIFIRKQPRPELELMAIDDISQAWHDEKPLRVRISARSTSPLKRIELRIRVGRNEAIELVNVIENNTSTEFDTDYELLLEPYLKQDLAAVELVAVGIDASTPEPLLGFSDPIHLETESAYGRYRKTLRTLRELKGDIDAQMEKAEVEVEQEALDLGEKALQKSLSTSFFDTLDRIKISEFASQLREQIETPSYLKKTSLQADLDQFLIEHEILDDRERDRDFFVAIRAYSRLLAQEPSKRPITVEQAAKNLHYFIESRRTRWTVRVAQLKHPETLEQWPQVKRKKPFLTAVTRSVELMKGQSSEATSQTQSLLTDTVRQYREWIEALEKVEDDERSHKEQKRQEGLASAREVLRELQKRQGKISADLDQAKGREKEELSERWPVTRMQQNENIKETRRLEAQLKALSPRAGARIEASLQAMRKTLKLGEASSYMESESFSDLAGRLLRSAEKESRKKEKGRSRARKRVTGDQYYGQSIHGGDLEISRDYQVDRRFREDILNEIQQGSYSEENKALMENYLRQIIR